MWITRVIKKSETRRSSAKMEGYSNRLFVITLTFLAVTVNLTNSYSQVRRSGASSAIEQLKNVVTQRTISTPIVPPMLKPSYDTPQIENTRKSANISKDSDREKEENVKQVGIQQFETAISALRGEESDRTNELEKELLNYVDETLSRDSYVFFDGVKIEPAVSVIRRNESSASAGSPRSARNTIDNEVEESDADFDGRVLNKFDKYARSHILSVNLPQTARFFTFKCKL